MGPGADLVYAVVVDGIMAKWVVPDGYALNMQTQKLEDCPNPKSRVRWIWSKYFGCWQWSTANASGLSNGIRTKQDEDNFYSDRFVAKWTQ